MSVAPSLETNKQELNPSKVPLPFLALGLVLPTVITWVYFVWLADAPPSRQQAAYGLGKGMQFLLLAFVLYGWMGGEIKRSLRRWKEIHASSWIAGLVSGLLIGGSILAIYLWLMLPLGVMESVREVAKAKLTAYGGDSVLGLAVIGLFYALFHSGLEELYWRGFIYRGFSRNMADHWALALSSLGFMAHHVLVLGKFFGYGSVWTYVCSAGVAVGGIIWGVMFRKTDSLWPTWLSHGLVDASLFLIGYHLVFVIQA
jgi:membrane protease YdiL (CAAX protease family)